jgi:hypothetical protein
MMQNNGSSEELTNCLVSLAYLGESYSTAYTNWLTEITTKSKEEMDSQLQYLNA